MTPYQMDHPLTDNELYLNTIISFYWARVEHINSFFVRHNLFRHCYRGEIDLLYDAVHTTAQMTSIHLHMFPRYAPVGSWPHRLDC